MKFMEVVSIAHGVVIDKEYLGWTMFVLNFCTF